jgi:hypothetical protein
MCEYEIHPAAKAKGFLSQRLGKNQGINFGGYSWNKARL